MDSLCGEAVEKIVEVVELAAVKQEETGGERRGRPQSEESCEGLTQTQTQGNIQSPREGAGLLEAAGVMSFCVSCVAGEDGGGEHPPTEQTYILVYGVSE